MNFKLWERSTLLNHEINMNKHQEVEVKKKNDISFKILTIDDGEEESENENLDLISKKFMKYVKLQKIKGRRLHSKKKFWGAKNKKTMVTPWNESNEDSMKEAFTSELVNICFMALEDHEDKVNSSPNYNELQDDF